MITRRQFLGHAGLLAVALACPSLAEETAGHERWMRRALECGARNPKAPFGAVIVDRQAQREVAWGVNHTVDGPIWHGEMDALQACPRREEGFLWSDLALYTTAEPCSMCQSAIMWAGLPLVVYGTSLPDLVAIGWDGIDLRAEEVARRTTFARCELLGGVLSADCDESFRRAVRLRKG